jgi:hypothetical protein
MTAEAERREHRMIVRWVELDALVRVLRNRQFQQNLVTGIIGLAALGRMVREGRTHMFTRLTAWDKRLARRNQPTAARHGVGRPVHGP